LGCGFKSLKGCLGLIVGVPISEIVWKLIFEIEVDFNVELLWSGFVPN
jgi:hypothetical protein